MLFRSAETLKQTNPAVYETVKAAAPSKFLFLEPVNAIDGSKLAAAKEAKTPTAEQTAIVEADRTGDRGGYQGRDDRGIVSFTDIRHAFDHRIVPVGIGGRLRSNCSAQLMQPDDRRSARPFISVRSSRST